jgi:hypothetical protein
MKTRSSGGVFLPIAGGECTGSLLHRLVTVDRAANRVDHGTAAVGFDKALDLREMRYAALLTGTGLPFFLDPK